MGTFGSACRANIPGNPKMPLQIEFYGIARVRTGLAETTVAVGTLTEVLGELGSRYPNFSETCLAGDNLADGFAANLCGDRFLTDPQEKLHDGDVLLIFSADAGG